MAVAAAQPQLQQILGFDALLPQNMNHTQVRPIPQRAHKHICPTSFFVGGPHLTSSKLIIQFQQQLSTKHYWQNQNLVIFSPISLINQTNSPHKYLVSSYNLKDKSCNPDEYLVLNTEHTNQVAMQSDLPFSFQKTF